MSIYVKAKSWRYQLTAQQGLPCVVKATTPVFLSPRLLRNSRVSCISQVGRLKASVVLTNHSEKPEHIEKMKLLEELRSN
jgi:hypothetical protein